MGIFSLLKCFPFFLHFHIFTYAPSKGQSYLLLLNQNIRSFHWIVHPVKIMTRSTKWIWHLFSSLFLWYSSPFPGLLSSKMACCGLRFWDRQLVGSTHLAYTADLPYTYRSNSTWNLKWGMFMSTVGTRHLRKAYSAYPKCTYIEKSQVSLKNHMHVHTRSHTQSLHVWTSRIVHRI